MDPKFPMRNTTLCYLERGDAYLMLHRVKKEHDANRDKWIGIGGKFEDKESPEDCLLRECREETGLTLTDYRYRGLVTFVNTEWPTEYMHLFTADEAVVTYGKLAMRWFCPFYFLLSILHGLAGAVRGTGASIPPMVVLLVSLCLFRVVWIQFLLPFFSGIEGVFILYPVSWGLGALLMILYAWKGKWMEYHT